MLVYRFSWASTEDEDYREENASGRPEVSGCSSVLEQLKFSKVMQKKMLALGKRRAAGNFGWRPMAEEVSKLLMLDHVFFHESVRRIYDSPRTQT